MGLFWTSLFQIFNCVFVPTFRDPVDYFCLLLQILRFQHFWQINFLDGNFVWCSWVHFTITKTMKKFCLQKDVSLYHWSVRPRLESHNVWLKIGSFWTKFDKIYFFLWKLPSILRCYARKDWKSVVCSRCKVLKFEFIDSLKNSGKKYFLIFENSCVEICNSKAFVHFATAGKHRALSTIYIKRNLFHQRKLGRDVELQNAHIVLLKFPREVMQVNTLSAQLGLGSELDDSYRDATSVPYGHLLIDLSPRTDDRLCFCTNTGSIP